MKFRHDGTPAVNLDSKAYYWQRKANKKVIKQNSHSFDLLAFITGNSSLEPLLEGLFAQIYIDLS